MMVGYRGQGAFEYMVSYGWAIVIAVVLGILLFSLGVLNPSQNPTASGFVYMRPISWSFTGGESHYTNVSMALENVGGMGMVLYVNDSTQQSIRFRPGASAASGCYFETDEVNVTVSDGNGNNISIIENKAAIPVGAVIKIAGRINGTDCGGLTTASYRYGIQIKGYDEYLIDKIDNGLVTGRYI